ncbi:I78 family peptidase inhibitor [Octadecabacter temperatus]|nr:I78 family peptidase inhibitor [Octadecabacter temperatus]
MKLPPIFVKQVWRKKMHHAIPSLAPLEFDGNNAGMKNLFAMAPIVFLFACEAVSPPQTVDPLPTPQQDTCNASAYSNLLGQDATALERVMLLGQVRVIRPGQVVTMDFRPDRINFNVGADNRITSIHCS